MKFMAFNLLDLQAVFKDPNFQAEVQRYIEDEKAKGYFLPRLQRDLSPRTAFLTYPGILDAEIVYEDILDAEFVDPNCFRLT